MSPAENDRGSYAREKHLTGKIVTLRLERNNLTLRTASGGWPAKRLGFSRTIGGHEKVIGSAIEKQMFC